MTDKSLKLILCDLGNVVVRFNHRPAVQKILSFTDKSYEDVYQIFFDSPLTEMFETGRIGSFDFFSRLSADLEITKLTFEEFTDIWNDIFFESSGMEDLLIRLKERYRLHLLSNINELHCDYILEKFSRVLSVFDKLFFSHQLGYRKPDKRAYRRCVEDCGYAPQETLYIDDREDLIRQARALGFETILFKNTGDLKTHLRNLGVLL